MKVPEHGGDRLETRNEPGSYKLLVLEAKKKIMHVRRAERRPRWCIEAMKHQDDGDSDDDDDDDDRDESDEDAEDEGAASSATNSESLG